MSSPQKQPKIISFTAHHLLQDPHTLGEKITRELLSLQHDLGPTLIAMCGTTTLPDLIFLRKCIQLRLPTITFQPPSTTHPQCHPGFSTLTSATLAHYSLPPTSTLSHSLIEWADALLIASSGNEPPHPDSTAHTLCEARALGIPTRLIHPTSPSAAWLIPPDPTRPARHGFPTRTDLLDFLDARFPP